MEHLNKRHEACKVWEARADALLEELGQIILAGVELPLVQAVHSERITPEEGQECVTAYLGTFLGDHGGNAA